MAYEAVPAPGVSSLLASAGYWDFAPHVHIKTIMCPFDSASGKNYAALSALTTAQCVTLFFARTTQTFPIGVYSFSVVVDNGLSTNFAFNDFTAVVSGGWVLAKNTGTGALVVSCSNTSINPLCWVSFATSAPTYMRIYTTSTTAPEAIPVGIQAMALSRTPSAPSACFGPFTLVVRANGSRLPIHSFVGPVDVRAVDADTKQARVITVRAYFRETVVYPVYFAQVAPHVWVTKDHTVRIPGVVRKGDTRRPDPEVVLDDCTWIAQDMVDGRLFEPCFQGVYHLVPTDPRHRGCLVEVGAAEGVLAEVYRSDARVLEALNGFQEC